MIHTGTKKIYRGKKYCGLGGLLMLALLPLSAQIATAQDPAAQAPATQAPATGASASVPVAAATPAAPVLETGPFTGILMFSPAEAALLSRAVEGRVTGSAILKAENPAEIPPVRQIRLSGVVFRKAGDWLLWINNQKVTPDSLLPEIVDITVQRDRVHLKWFDAGLNAVLNIEMRPHQVYDITTGILLPG